MLTTAVPPAPRLLTPLRHSNTCGFRLVLRRFLDLLVPSGISCLAERTCSDPNLTRQTLWARQSTRPSGAAVQEPWRALDSECRDPAEVGPVRQRTLTWQTVLAAIRRVGVPASQVHAPAYTLVNLETTFWNRADQIDRSLSLIGFAVDVEVTPTSYTWNWGDGTSTTTQTPGRRYPSKTSPTHTRMPPATSRRSRSASTRPIPRSTGWTMAPGSRSPRSSCSTVPPRRCRCARPAPCSSPAIDPAERSDVCVALATSTSDLEAPVPTQKCGAPQSMSLRDPTVDQSEVTSPVDQSFRRFPPASSPAVAVSRLTVRNLGFRPIPPSLSGGREEISTRVEKGRTTPTTKKLRLFSRSTSYPQTGLVRPPFPGRRPPQKALLHTLSPPPVDDVQPARRSSTSSASLRTTRDGRACPLT